MAPDKRTESNERPNLNNCDIDFDSAMPVTRGIIYVVVAFYLFNISKQVVCVGWR